MVSPGADGVPPDFDPDDSPGVLRLLLSLARYIHASDVQLEKVDFLRNVAVRILGDLSS